MMVLKVFLCASLCMLVGLLTSNAEKQVVTAGTIYEHSELWPFYVTVDSEAANLKAGGGFSGILNRIQPSGQALIDFGRDGLHTIPLEHTDIVERATLIQQGEEPKEQPNFIRSTTNMFVDYRGFGDSSLRKSEDLKAAAFLLLVYCPDTWLMTPKRVSQLEALRDAVRLNDGIELFIPTSIKFYDTIVGVELRGINMMLPHMSIAHVKSLGHAPDLGDALSCVLIDSNGKVYEKWQLTADESGSDLLHSKVSNLSVYVP